MKTKNIFRMLLIAVVLLVGANNVKATENTIWTGSAQPWSSYWEIGSNNFSGIDASSVLRVYVDGPSQIYLSQGNGNWQAIWDGQTDFEGGSHYNSSKSCYEFTIGDAVSALTSNGMYIQAKGATITEVTLESEGSGSGSGTSSDPVTPTPTPYNITYNVSVGGTVVANPGPDSANSGETVELVVTPDTGYELTSLIVRDQSYQEITMTDETHFVMPEKAVVIYATFSQINYTITWTTPDHVNYFSLPQTAHYNDEITPSYSAVDGFAIDQFTVTAEDGTAIEVVDNKFTMPAQNVTVNITFSGAKYTLTWAIDGESEPYLVQELATGDPIAEPETPTKNGYTFNGWGYHPETMPAQNTTVTGSFSAASYTITLTTPQHGNVSLPQTASYNSEVGFYNLQADNGYELESITVTGEDGTNIPVTADNKFTMPAQNVTVTVTFRANTTVTYSVWNGNGIQNGSVSANPNYQVEPGTTITLSSTPNEGYELDYYSISTDGTNYNAIEGNTFSMPGSNVWVIATFKQTDTPAPTTYAVNIASGIQNGSISANPSNAAADATVTLTVTPAQGYVLESLTVTDANSQTVTVNNNQFTMPASDVTVTATFKEAPQTDFTFTINVTGEGTINLYRETAKEGEVININAFPNNYNNYELGEVTVVDADGNQITVTDNKFTMPASNVTINATFVGKMYTLTWQIKGEAEAYLVEQVRYGDEIVEPAQAPTKEGYVFAGWETHDTTMGAGDKTINGAYYYNIYLVYDETQGTVTIDKSMSLGNEELHLTITPAEGLQIASVTATDATGNLQVWGDYTTFRIGASDVTVTVTFKEADAVVYNVTNNNDAVNGRVWADVYQAVAGQVVNLGNQPNYGYQLDYYVVTAGDEEIEVTNGQFTMPESDVTISGVFKLGTYTITYYVDGNVWETQTYTYGDTIVLPSEPSKSGYRFNGWQGINQTMPGSDLQVYANFIQEGQEGQGTEDDTEYVNVTVGSTGYATFCSNKALDVTGLSVYYAVSIDDENVTLRKLTGVVAAGTGLLVKGNTSIPVSSEGGTTYNDNLLVGVLTTTEAPSGAYVLISKDGEATFAQTYDESKATVPAGKAYLMAPSGARYLSIKFDDNATGISTMKMELTDDDVIYNLRGQRVSNPRSGLYIVNGKKIFIK